MAVSWQLPSEILVLLVLCHGRSCSRVIICDICIFWEQCLCFSKVRTAAASKKVQKSGSGSSFPGFSNLAIHPLVVGTDASTSFASILLPPSSHPLLQLRYFLSHLFGHQLTMPTALAIPALPAGPFGCIGWCGARTGSCHGCISDLFSVNWASRQNIPVVLDSM